VRNLITQARQCEASVEQISAVSGHLINDVTRVVEGHHLAPDEETNEAMILKLERGESERFSKLFTKDL